MTIKRAAALILWLVLVPGIASAAESRCTALGANCICSEPMQGTMVKVGVDYINPSDSTTKACNIELGNPIIVSGDNANVNAASDSAVLNLIPNRSAAVTQYLRASEGKTGTWQLGHILSGGDPIVRTAIRIYRFYSSNTQLTGEGSCTNGKLMNTHQSGFTGTTHGTTDHSFGGGVQFYSIVGGYTINNNGTAINDCCLNGPNLLSGINAAGWKGKWWRLEYVVQNRETGPTTFVLYRKNITDNLPEEIVVDTRTADLSTGPTAWTTADATTMTPINPLRWFDSDAYRAGTCTGWFAHAYLMVASWSTDTGQRIGAATEMEGGGAAICGNSSVEAGETCDDGSQPIDPCIYGDSPPFTQVCNATCNGLTNCSGPMYCGDSIANGSEQCDGPALNGHTCLEFGCSVGTPTCTSCQITPVGCFSCVVPTLLRSGKLTGGRFP